MSDGGLRVNMYPERPGGLLPSVNEVMKGLHQLHEALLANEAPPPSEPPPPLMSHTKAIRILFDAVAYLTNRMADYERSERAERD